jgi:hypothetical protein
MCWVRAFTFFAGAKMSATAVMRSWSRLAQQASIFTEVSSLLMGQSQNKLASIRLDSGASGFVCDKLEAARRRRACRSRQDPYFSSGR